MSRFSSVLPKEPFFENKSPFFQLVFLLLFVLAGMCVFSAVALLGAFLIWGSEVTANPTADYYRFVQLFSAIGTFLLPAIWFSHCAEKRCFTYNRADQPVRGAGAFALVCVMAVALLPVISLLAYFNQQMRLPEALAPLEQWMQRQTETNNAVLELLMSEAGVRPLILNIVVCAVLPAVSEEFFFRGTLQELFRRWWKNPHVAVWFTAFIFSAIHFQFDGFFARMVLGAYLGYLFVWSGSLWLPVCAHLLHNAFTIIAQYVMMANGMPMGEEPSLSQMWPAAVAGMAVFVVSFLMLYRNLCGKR